MCGGYRLETDPESLASAFGVGQVQLELPWSVELYPGSKAPVVLDRRRGETEQERYLGALSWGLIPAWARDPGVAQRLFNARAETLHEKPSFQQAFARRRCLVPAQAFFEWSGEPGRKHKHAFWHPDHTLLAMAGLWEVWPAPDGTRRGTFTVVTTEANPAVEPLHPRMPLMVPPEWWDRWLAVGEEAQDVLPDLQQATQAMPLAHTEVPR